QGAKLVSGAADILEDLETFFPLLGRKPVQTDAPKSAASPDSLTLTQEEKAVLESLGNGQEDLDGIVSKTRLPTSRVSSTLLALEMKRLVKKLPGQQFVKLNP
ncbi:MAG: hypothetical protein V4710_19820, partial [Verrucomicrobiota bacterium]